MKKRNLALVELTLVILFTALSAAVLVQVFAAARTASDESRAQTMGQAMAQDIIERWKAGEAPETLFAGADGWQALPPEDWGTFVLALPEEGAAGEEVVPAGVYLLWLGRELAPAAEGETLYSLEVSLGEESCAAGVLHHIAVRLVADHTGRELVSFVTAQYEHTAK